MACSCPERGRAMSRNAQASFSRNRLLSIMSSEDFERLRPHLERVTLNAKDVLESPGEPIQHVYFLEPCVASVVAITAQGEKMEVGLFGPRECPAPRSFMAPTGPPWRRSSRWREA